MKTVILLTLLFSSSVLGASVEFRSREGVEISINYELESTVSNSNKPTSTDYAKNIQFKVSGDFAGRERIRVVVTNFEDFRGYCGLPSEQRRPDYVIDLESNGIDKTFVGSFETARIILNGKETPLRVQDRRLQVRFRGYCESIFTRQEVSVVLDGRWLIDPVNGTNNFRFNLLR